MKYFFNKRLIYYVLVFSVFFNINTTFAEGYKSDLGYYSSYNFTEKKAFTPSLNRMQDWELFNNPHSPSSSYFGQPTGIWLTRESNQIDYIKRILDQSAETAPIFVVYFAPTQNNIIPSEKEIQDYLYKNIQIAQLIGNQRAIIVIEPDLLYLCSTDKELLKTNQQLINQLTRIYKAFAPKTKVYLDAGHSNWHAPSRVAKILNNAGIKYADGFATNVSNFQTTENEISYALQLSKMLNNKHFIIDTSRNGNGPGKPRENCPPWGDPEGISTGLEPTTITNVAYLDALLWVKPPGEADGVAYPAGTWHPELVQSDNKISAQ
jgi:endoglucanase